MKGRKMPGRMGGERTTVKNLKIVKIDAENNILIIKGAIPGRTGALLEIRG
jgi:large subunit ribosomal protein L3